MEAEGLAVQPVAVYERSRSPDHPDTTKSQSILAKILLRHGNLDEAEEMSWEALAAWQNVLGLEHPDSFDIPGSPC